MTSHMPQRGLQPPLPVATPLPVTVNRKEASIEKRIWTNSEIKKGPF